MTPSFNQGSFLEQTIRSVLSQGYPRLEYMVIDGGSSDGSSAVLRRYAPHLSHWESRQDRGQSHAINKGLALATGEILGWLNSDDYYPPGTLATVASVFSDNSIKAIVGPCQFVQADGSPAYVWPGRFEGRRRLLQPWRGYYMNQPSIFWRREVFEKVGFLDETQHLVMDLDYWLRIADDFSFGNVDRVLACATLHPEAKTSDGFHRYQEEARALVLHRTRRPWTTDFWIVRASLAWHLASSSRRKRS